jgi:hypothetical protein
MSMDDFTTMEEVKEILTIKDSITKYDEVISALIYPITNLTFVMLSLDESTLIDEKEIEFVKFIIGISIGCQIQIGDPTFGQKYKEYKVGNIEKQYLSRIKKDFDDWCTFKKEMLELAKSIYGEGFIGSVSRTGVSNDYPTPY